MFPGTILDGLKFVPNEFTSSILIAMLNKVAVRFSPGHRLQGCIHRCIARDAGHALLILADEEPFLTALGVMEDPRAATAKPGARNIPLSLGRRVR